MTEVRRRPLQEFLLQCVLADESAGVSLDPSRFIFQQLREAADMHRITPAIARRVANSSAPEEWKQHLAAARHAQIFRHMLASADLAALGRVLDEHSVTWVVAKGPVASDLIWPRPDMREYYDVDVFVTREHFATALEVLLDEQFLLVDQNWPELARTQRAEIALTGPNGSHLDLHWDMAVTPGLRRAFANDYAGMIARSRPARLSSGVRVGVFDPVDTVLHLAFHAAQAGANRLMWAGDIHYAAQADGFSWEELQTRVRGTRFETPMALVVDRTDRALGFRIPPPSAVLEPGKGTWGRVARRHEAGASFPGLPGDSGIGGNVVSSARSSVASSSVALLNNMVLTTITERRVRRNGADDRVLRHAIPDQDARRRYLNMVRGGC